MSNSNPNHDIAEIVVNDQVREIEGMTLESVTSKENGLLHIVLDYDVHAGEGPFDTDDAVPKVFGVYRGILTDTPGLYERAAVDFHVKQGVRVRYELPTPWFHANIAGEMDIEELWDRVWETAHLVDPDGTPRSIDEFPEIAEEIWGEQGPPE